MTAPLVALTIAGSDSGGGAGIQADLAVFRTHGVFGTSAITAITAQNTRAVHTVRAVSAGLVRAQVEAVLDDLPVAAVKTGLLPTAEVIESVGALAADGRLPNLVVDPVITATTGRRLAATDSATALAVHLVPHARAITPNLAEAQALLGTELHTMLEVTEAARALHALGPELVVITGGHAPGHQRHDPPPPEVIDVAVVDGRVHLLRRPRVDTSNDHGTGCAFSAALAVHLARQLPPLEAVHRAAEHVHTALHRGARWRLGTGRGPLTHLHPESS